MNELNIGNDDCKTVERGHLFSAGPAGSAFPSRMQVEVTTRCNMNCSMCVKYAPDSLIEEADLSIDLFRKLGPALESCQFLVLNGIGEPLLHPDLPEMAAFARERMPDSGSIGFQTNGLLITESLARKLVLSGVDTFCISVDSLDSENDAECELHGQCSVDRLKRSFRILREAAAVSERKIRLGVEFVLMKDTFEQLPDVLSWAAEQGAEFMICSHVFAYDPSMQQQSLFNPNTPAATDIFKKWKELGIQRGLDLHDYFDVLWRIKKEGPREEYFELGRQMRTEAKSKDVWFHLSSLLEWDSRSAEEWQDRVRNVYSRSRQLAERAGFDLQLPPLMASNELSCSFIEEGAAFITSQGDVSPCQFLWHGYTCYMDGSEKVIKPRLFGNLAEKDFADIWRDKKYVSFRGEVLEYEYPYCSNCPMVPCDDIVGRSYDFEFDCFGATVPCGHCPWAMGGLKCLL